MKPNQLASLLGISPVTLREWAREDFSQFLSPSAQGINGARRSFSDRDARILSWVATLKTQNIPIKEIIAILRSSQDHDWNNLPPLQGVAGDEPFAMIPREAVVERLRAIEYQYQNVVKQRDELERVLEVERQDNRAVIDRLQTRIAELSEQAAELRGKLEQYTVGGRRLNAVTLAGLALLTGIAITLIIIALLSIK